MKITIQAERDQLDRVIPLVRQFLAFHPGHHAMTHPERKGVLFVYRDGPQKIKLHVWGNARHVRVRQVE